MGHKSKADRQREAIARKLQSVLPYNLGEVRQALRFLREHPHGKWEGENPMRSTDRLVRVQMECGIERSHAEGMARSVLNGGDGKGWLSGPPISEVVVKLVGHARQKQPAPGEGDAAKAPAKAGDQD